MPHSNRTAAGVAGGVLGLIGLSVVAGVLVTATVTPAVAVTSAAATGAIDMFNNLPSVLTIDKPILPSTIYYKNDKGKDVPLATYYDQNRVPVTFKQINPLMFDAILSSEDPRFYEHGGIDLIGTTRALLSNIKGGAATQGGSSISQQYVKNVLIEQCDWNAKTSDELNACWVKATDSSGPDGIQRKVQEMRYSIALEQRYSKDQILLGYLNIANFGGTTYGIEAAAMHYFGVHAADLSLAQAATLAGMVQNPNVYRFDMPGGSITDKSGKPLNSAKDGYKLTKDRQDYVLGRMLHDGKITKAQHDEAVKAPITPKITNVPAGCSASFAAYFCQYVTDTIINDPAFGKTRTDRQQLLQRGGLKIYTTLDPRVQKAAQDAQNQYIPSSVNGYNFGSTSVSVEAGTGRVLAMAQNTTYTAGTSKDKGTSSIVYAGDQRFGGSIGFNAGSTFKLFTLIDWLEQGHSLNQNVNGLRRTISTWNDRCVAGGKLRAAADIHNYAKEAGRYGTPMQFTKISLNSGFMGMAEQLDLCDIGNVATRLGVSRGDGYPIPLTTDNTNKNSANNPAPAEIIGSDNVSPLAMAGAYAAIANNGIFCQPKVIDKVVDSEAQDLTLPTRTCTQVIDPKVAATAAFALQGPLTGPNGSGMQGNPNDGTQLIGKTGTHEDYQTWLITSNTKVTTANWVGSVSGQVPLFTLRSGWRKLSDLRFPLARAIQGAVDQIYPGGRFPAPDATLTRQVLVDLPNVVGMAQADAQKVLETAGFQVTVGPPVDSPEAAGTIAAQTPGPGKVSSGTMVTINPSTGNGMAVPDVTGQDPASAMAMLKAAGFKKVSLSCAQSDTGDGTVSGTNPPAGTVAGPDTKIAVTYSAPSCKGGNGGNGG